MTSTADRATQLRALHTSPKILTLVNVWDVASARAVAAVEGTTAIATASHAIAATYGYPDGEEIPVDLMLDMAGRIAADVDLPVTADLEAGYGNPGETIRRAIGLGIVGANLEDEMKPLTEAVAAVTAAIGAAEAEGVPGFVLNARTDAFLRAGDQDRREVLDDAIARGRAFLDAGAPVVFVPGLLGQDEIEALVEAFGQGRLSLIGSPGMLPASTLERLGVARLSFGPLPPARRPDRSPRAGRGHRRRGAAGDAAPHLTRLPGRVIRVNEVLERFREVARACEGDVFWTPRSTPSEALALVARQAEELGIDRWDVYAERGAVARLEEEVAGLLGKPAAAMFPSGIMAQQAVLRVHCDRRGSLRVGIPELSHLLQYEDDGPRLLHGFRFEHLSAGRLLPTVADLDRLGAGLGAVLLELPLRDAGCLLPEWDDLVAVTARARELGAAVHLDGARIWECQPFYGTPLADIAGVGDSIYVSFYKGLGGLSGACLAGEEDVVAEARRWRKRMGGTLFHLTPLAVSALAGLRDYLPKMPEYVAWGHSLATHLVSAGIRVHPDPPHTNTFELFAEAEPDAINESAIAFMERTGIQPCGAWRAAPVPGHATCEVAVHAAALSRDPAEVADWLTGITGV